MMLLSFLDAETVKTSVKTVTSAGDAASPVALGFESQMAGICNYKS
jgi:hypothetical protein